MGDNKETGVHVKVAVRCRPLNSREKAAGNLHVVTTEPSQNRVRVAHKKLDRTYQYDHVFGPFASQEEVFVSTVQPIVREMLQGYSTTVFAYGQTGTGKTFTMEGEISCPDNMGVIPRSVHAIFDYLDRISADYTVRTSFLELYNEELQDLLADSSSKNKVVLREDARRGVVCCGLEEIQVLSAKDIFAILSRGIQQRKTAETLMNKNSSRSHSIFTLKIMIKECMPDGEEVMRNGQLNLVDLAGSECVGRSGAKNARAREAGSINQSLLTLGRVITALVEHHPHVPYRDSKLTRLLQESLGGRAKTCIIATVTSSSDALEETLSSLDYAMKAKSIQNKPVANQKLSKTHLLKEYAGELESLRSMLQASRDKNGVYLEPWRYDHMENTLESQANQIAEMEAVLAMRNNETKELKSDRDRFQQQATELSGELSESRADQERTAAELGRTRTRLEGVEGELAASRADAAQLRRQLKTTQDALKVREEELMATRAVVAEQSATEASLTAEAEQTKRSLELAEEDIGQLRAKIARQDDDAMARRARAERFGGDARKATMDMTAAVTLFGGEHRKGCDDLRETLTVAEQATRRAAEALSSAAMSALEQASLRCKDMADGVGKGGQAAGELLGAASTGLEEALSAQRRSMKEWEAQMGGSLGNLRRGLEGHQRELSLLCEEVRRRAEEAERDVGAFKEKCETELASVRAWSEERLASQAKEMESRRQEAVAMAVQAKEQARVDAEGLMQSVGALVSAMQAKASALAEQQARVSGAAWNDSVAASRDFSLQMSERVGGVSSALSSGSRGVQDNLGQASVATQDAIQEHAAQAGRFAASTSEIHEGVSAGVARSVAQGVSAASALEAGVADASKAVAKAASTCQESAAGLSAASDRAAEGVAKLAAEAGRDAAERSGEATAQVRGLVEAVGGLGAKHEALVGVCAEQVQEYVREACSARGASGATPERKRYPRPDAFSTTRSHNDIMLDFRASACVVPPPSPDEFAAPSSVPQLAEDGGDETGLGGTGFGGVSQNKEAIRRRFGWDVAEEEKSGEEMDQDEGVGGEGPGDESAEGRNGRRAEEQAQEQAQGPAGQQTSSAHGARAANGHPERRDDVEEARTSGSNADASASANGGPPLGEATNIEKGKAGANSGGGGDGTAAANDKGGSKIPTLRRSVRRARAA